MNAQVIAVVNQKGGTGKSTTCANLGIGLAQAGKKVLVVDVDPQASLSISLGHSQPDDLPVTLSDLMGKVLNDQPIAPGEGILHHAEGVDLMPSNIQLSGMEVSLVNAMSRETILRQYLDTVRKQYTHMLDEIRVGNVATVIIKDQSRIGRDVVEVGLLKRTFDEYHVRFIAANDNLDTANGFDIMSIFRDVINEWYVADTSRKIKAVFKSRMEKGLRCSGSVC